MKKLLAIGITAIGGFGLLGMGATAASAVPIGPAHTIVCTSAAAQLTALSVPQATAAATLSVATTAAATALTGVTTAEGNYITSALKVINDVDGTPVVTAATQAADVANFNASITSFVNAVVASSAANVAKFNAQAVVTQLALQQQVLQDMQTGAGCVVV